MSLYWVGQYNLPASRNTGFSSNGVYWIHPFSAVMSVLMSRWRYSCWWNLFGLLYCFSSSSNFQVSAQFHHSHSVLHSQIPLTVLLLSLFVEKEKVNYMPIKFITVAYSRLDALLLWLLLYYHYCKYCCCFFRYEACRPEFQRKTLNFVESHIILYCIP